MANDLPKLRREVKITEKDGLPTFSYHQWWDRLASNLNVDLAEIGRAHV